MKPKIVDTDCVLSSISIAVEKKVSTTSIHEGRRLKKIIQDKGIKITNFARLVGFSNQIAHYYFAKEKIKNTKLLMLCNLLGIDKFIFYNWHKEKYQVINDSTHHGNRFRLLMAKKSANKADLSRRMGISRRGLYNLMEVSVYSPKQIVQVCKALDITADAFIGKGEEKEENWREKYYLLLGKHIKLLEENNIQRHELEILNKMKPKPDIL